MSIKVDIRGRVLKSTKLDVQGSSVVTELHLNKSRHSFVALCSTKKKVKKIIQHTMS